MSQNLNEIDADFVAELEKISKEIPQNNSSTPMRKEFNLTFTDCLKIFVENYKK